MASELSGPVVPAQFRTANSLLGRAIQITMSGLRSRDEAIAQNNDALFERSSQLLPQGHGLVTRAYAAYPDYARPQPAPIL